MCHVLPIRYSLIDWNKSMIKSLQQIFLGSIFISLIVFYPTKTFGSEHCKTVNLRKNLLADKPRAIFSFHPPRVTKETIQQESPRIIISNYLSLIIELFINRFQNDIEFLIFKVNGDRFKMYVFLKNTLIIHWNSAKDSCVAHLTENDLRGELSQDIPLGDNDWMLMDRSTIRAFINAETHPDKFCESLSQTTDTPTYSLTIEMTNYIKCTETLLTKDYMDDSYYIKFDALGRGPQTKTVCRFCQ